MVSKTPASRSEACPSIASVVASSCATLKSSNPAAMPLAISADADPARAAGRRFLVDPPSICRITRGSRVAVAAVRFCMTSVRRAGIHHVDDAHEVAIRRDDRGRLRGQHRRSIRREVRRDHVLRELADGADVAGNLEHAPLHGFVEHFAAIRDGAHDRPPQIVLAPRGMLDVSILEDAGEIDLFDRDRDVPLLEPHFGGASASAHGVDVFRHEGEQRLEGLDRHVAEKRELQDVVLVEPRRGFADRTIGAGRRSPDQERFRRHAEGECLSGRRAGQRGPQAVDRRADGRVVRRIERPASCRRHERARERQDAARELRGKRRHFGHFAEYRSLNQLILIYSGVRL